MPGIRPPSPSPLAFRRRSLVNGEPTPPADNILFPKFYEDAWGSTREESVIEHAHIFLLRIIRMSDDPAPTGELRAIVTSQQHRTLPALAEAIQKRIFANRHASFATDPVKQCVRFMLIKGKVHEQIFSDRTRAVMDFFFDPTSERNLKPQPAGEMVMYPYPSGRLKVAIVGGGPTALASAISLAEKGAGKVEVHLYERRWVRVEGPSGASFVDYPGKARRRDQVVTLQDNVTKLLSKESYQALFAGRPERVWPGSANIQIRKVEDRFLKRVQEPEFEGLIHLHTGGMTKEDLSTVGDFHVLLGADGAASWVRKSYFHGFENERGKSWALGLAFDRPAGLPWSQPLNVFLTLGQTRYLLNASDFDGRGYLNMQLTDDEWHKMVALDGQPVHFGRPGCLRRPDGSVPVGFEESQVFAPSEKPDSPLWISILDGLKLFGFKEEEVINIVRIPIVVQAVKEGVQLLPPEDAPALRRPHALVAVAGDAAMTVHFWPGRGLNSGIKSGIALGDEIVYALNKGQFVGMPLSAMKEYNDFILKLQGREHDKRSIPILNQSGSPEMLGWLLDKANSVPDNVAIEWLVGAMKQIGERLETRPDWAYEPVLNVEPQLRIILRQLDSVTLKEMAVSFPWPTREMGGAEVMPIRTMKPEEKQKWMQSLWGMLQDKTKQVRPASRSDAASRSPSPAAARFEAPRSKSPGAPRSKSPGPPSGGLSRSNATQSLRHGRTLSVPGAEGSGDRIPSPSPGRASGEASLGRMLTLKRTPPEHFLGDALSLALFRVQEAT